VLQLVAPNLPVAIVPGDMFVVGVADPAKFIVPQRILDSNATMKCQVSDQARLL
jgi:hypothetical protein